MRSILQKASLRPDGKAVKRQRVPAENLLALCSHCDEFLIHAVDVEGMKSGVDSDLIEMLGSWENGIPVTYAGGVSSIEDLEIIKKLGRGRVDFSVGSALSIFGGDLDFKEIINYRA